MSYDEQIKKSGAVDVLTALLWCKEKFAVLEFTRGGQVLLEANQKIFVRDTIVEAVLACTKEEQPWFPSPSDSM